MICTPDTGCPVSGVHIKVCRAPEKGKSHEESYDSSWDFGALEGTRIPGPLIKSQMLYRLSYERIYLQQNNTAELYYHNRRKKARGTLKKLAFRRRARGAAVCPCCKAETAPAALPRQKWTLGGRRAELFSDKFPFTNPARIVTIKATSFGLFSGPGCPGLLMILPLQEVLL